MIKEKLTNIDAKSKTMTPKPVKDAKEFYNYFVDEVEKVYKIVDESVDSLVEVWNSLVKFQGELKKNFSLWHFEIFDAEIWKEHNIRIIL